MAKLLPSDAHRVQGIRVSAWTRVPGERHCSMRFIDGTDPRDVANRVAFIEKTPRVRVQPFNSPNEDSYNWHQGYKGDDSLNERSRGWCDTQLLALGYLVPDAVPYEETST